MKTEPALFLVIALMVWPLPVSAQEPGGGSLPGPAMRANDPTRSITTATARFLAREQGAQPGVNWKKLRGKHQGNAITLTIRDGTVVKGRFIRADEESIKVLVPQPRITWSAKEQFEEASKAEVWTRGQQDWGVTLPDKTRITPRGVFSPSGDVIAELRTFVWADVVAARMPMSIGKKIGIVAAVAVLVPMVLGVIAFRGGA